MRSLPQQDRRAVAGGIPAPRGVGNTEHFAEAPADNKVNIINMVKKDTIIFHIDFPLFLIFSLLFFSQFDPVTGRPEFNTDVLTFLDMRYE
jgi:hypothetical protein